MEDSIMQKRIWLITVLFIVLIAIPPFYAHGESGAQIVPFDSPRWELPKGAQQEENYKGKQCLRLQGGKAVLKDVDFTHGIIEFDVCFAEGRGFFGGFFRLQNPEYYEEFYLRSHQSGNPDAFQYSPVYNSMASWQLYHGDGYSGVAKYKFDQWMHIILKVAGDRAELYIEDAEKPVLAMHLMQAIKPGKVGVYALRFAPGYFADFKVRPMAQDQVVFKTPRKAPAKPKPGTVTAWSVSNVFPEKAVAGKTMLTEADAKNLSWEPVACEASGLANIARVRKLARPNNTVFMRMVVESSERQVKLMRFGYSDRAAVYCNNRLLYKGNNNYRSRDYRYLGTIGYFDAVALPLEKGRNELWLAVSENFGGWGIKCRFEDFKGIKLAVE